MTPRKLYALLHERLAFEGKLRDKVTIDDVVPF